MNNNDNNQNSSNDNDNDGPNWKWWHFLLAGILITAWCIWRWWETGKLKHLGGLVLAGLCILLSFGMRKEAK